MLLSTLGSSLLAASSAFAATPPGFTPAANATLDVYYGSTYITPGLMVKKSTTAKAPTIGLTNVTLSGKYILAMIDIDLPNGNGLGSAPTRGTVLHALLQDFTPSGATQNGTPLLATKATGPTSYFGPAPPAETPKHPHNYVFVLHAQPANFAVPASQKSVVQSRLNIDWNKFVKEAGLGAPIAGNYLQVQSGDNTRRWEA